MPKRKTQKRANPAETYLPWLERLWHDLPQYVCRLCSYETLEERAIEAHYDAEHRPPAPKPASTRLFVTDRFGNVVSAPAAEAESAESEV